MGSRHDRIEVTQEEEVTMLDMGDMEIWDGADLALIRDTLFELIQNQGCNSVGIVLSSVKFIPSGFFGMLYDWYEQGVTVRLYNPQPNVSKMLWFRQFFFEEELDAYRLVNQAAPKTDPVIFNHFDALPVSQNQRSQEEDNSLPY